MNPAGLLKLVAALMPLIGNAELGQAIVAEIRAMFEAMQRSAAAMEAVDRNLQSISQQLEEIALFLKMPVGEETIDKLISYNGAGGPQVGDTIIREDIA